MKNNWRMLILGFPVLAAGLTYAWRLQKDGFLEYVFNIPIVGNMFKEIEFTHLFLKLFIYIKSGISITEALSHIQSTQKTFVTNKLVGIKNRINSGHSLGEAFEKDGFFPPFLCQSLKKADETGKRTEYFYEIYKYYDSKSKASVQAMIKLINPLLMSLAFAFAGFIASFYVLIYRNMAVMSSSLYS
ncbi:MAG: type II secretion system F family protein [Candidatus Omnitrophica bacterium]|nr:type II secretion system F family protein [Candidatus Omnitrophota bacterium]